MLRVMLAPAFLLTLLSFSEQAFAATLILQDQEVLSSEPKLEAPDLRGKLIWLGGQKGSVGSAKFIRKGTDADEVLLNEEFGSVPLLGYSAQSQFLAVNANEVRDADLRRTIVARLKELDADISTIAILSAAEVDIDGDGAKEAIVKVQAPRASEDAYAGNASAFEGLFVVSAKAAKRRIIGEVVPSSNSEDEPRSNIDLLAIGKNPATNVWEFLVRTESRQWAEGQMTVNITINGKSANSSENLTRTSNTQIRLYRYDQGTFAAYDRPGYGSSSTCFGANCH